MVHRPFEFLCMKCDNKRVYQQQERKGVNEEKEVVIQRESVTFSSKKTALHLV